MNTFKYSILLAFFFSLFLFTQYTYASTDIILKDNKENNELSILVNSNDEVIPGIDMTILFSEDITVDDVIKGDYCSMLFDKTVSQNKIGIECFNTYDVKMNGILAKIKYKAQNDDYFFYIDETTLDIGSLQLGEISNINKPETVNTTENIQSKDENKENSKYFLYIGVFLVIILLAFLLIPEVKENLNKRKNTD